jgi:DNA-binding MarR family transcriptional regulator
MNKNTKQARPPRPSGKAARDKIMDYLTSHQTLIANVTVRDIGSELYYATAVVQYHLDKLEETGKIQRLGHGAIRILKNESEAG